MPSNPYSKATGAYRSANLTLPPVRGVAALLERCQQHAAAASRHAGEGSFELYAREINAAISILTGLSLYVGAYLPAPDAQRWQQMLSGLIMALGRSAAGRDVALRIRASHDRIASLRLLWIKLAGLDRQEPPPLYPVTRRPLPAGDGHG